MCYTCIIIMEFVRIGIIGIGNMGRSHGDRLLKNEVPHMRLFAACDIDSEARAWAKEHWPNVPIYESAEEMFEKAELDAALIAVPHFDHAKYTIMAFERGLHVYCEKPSGVYTKQVMDMIEASKKYNKVFSAGFQQRTTPVFQKIREMVQSGELGHIKKIIWIITSWYRPQAYHDSSAWRSTWKYEGGGTIVNQNPHNIDLFQWMFGMPDQVLATIDYGKYYDIEVDDDVSVLMRYDNGTIGIYTTSTGEQPGTNRLEISCDMGKLVYENGVLTFWRNEMSERAFNLQNTRSFPSIKCTPEIIEVPHATMQQHNALLENFALAVITGSPLLAPGEDSIREVTLADSFYYSDWTSDWVSTKEFPHDDFYARLMEKGATSTYVKKVHKTEPVDMGASFQK